MDQLPILGEFTDTTGQRWSFDEEAILAVENGAELHLYREHDFDKPTAEQCAQLIGVEIQAA